MKSRNVERWLRNVAGIALGMVIALPTLAVRPDIVWMQGSHSNEVRRLDYSPDGKILVSSAFDGSLKVRRTSDYRLLYTLPTFNYDISPDGEVLATGILNAVSFHRLRDGKLLFTLPSKNGDLSFSHDGSLFVETGWEAGWDYARVWNLRDQQLLYNFQQDDSNTSYHFALLPGNRTYATVDAKGTIFIKRMDDNSVLRSFGESLSVYDMAVTPDGRTLVSYESYDHLKPVIKAWDIESGKLLGKAEVIGELYRNLDFSWDSRYVALGWYNKFHLIELMGGQILTPFPEENTTFISTAFSPDGDTVATGGRYEINIWNLYERQPLFEIEGPGDLTSVGFGPDGRTVATTGYFIGAVHHRTDFKLAKGSS
jgi:WD40 repeat protein